MSQPQHTPGSCGCYISPPREDIGQALYYCPTHAAAPEMLTFILKIVTDYEASLARCSRYTRAKAAQRPEPERIAGARALLAKIEGGNAHV